MKKERGITLVALVITIIVLLILAGVVMSTLTGKDNIITNAGTTVGKYNTQQETDEAVLNTIAGYLEAHMQKGENGGGNEEGEDIIEPEVELTVTANQETIDTTIMQSNTFDSLFTVVASDGGTATKTYTLNGETTSYNNTSELPAGTYTLTCTATYEGKTASANVSVTMAKNYWSGGDTVTIPERC